MSVKSGYWGSYTRTRKTFLWLPRKSTTEVRVPGLAFAALMPNASSDPVIRVWHNPRPEGTGILIHGSSKSTCYFRFPIHSRGSLLPMLSLKRGGFLLPRGTVMLPLYTQHLHSRIQDVYCRIRIATNLYSTVRTWMSSSAEWLFHSHTTIRAILRRIVRLHCHNCLLPDLPVVVQPLSELIPASIRNRLSQVVILDHIRNLQILIDDDIVRRHYASGLLYCPIFTLSLDF